MNLTAKNTFSYITFFPARLEGGKMITKEPKFSCNGVNETNQFFFLEFWNGIGFLNEKKTFRKETEELKIVTNALSM